MMTKRIKLTTRETMNYSHMKLVGLRRG